MAGFQTIIPAGRINIPYYNVDAFQDVYVNAPTGFIIYAGQYIVRDYAQRIVRGLGLADYNGIIDAGTPITPFNGVGINGLAGQDLFSVGFVGGSAVLRLHCNTTQDNSITSADMLFGDRTNEQSIHWSGIPLGGTSTNKFTNVMLAFPASSDQAIIIFSIGVFQQGDDVSTRSVNFDHMGVQYCIHKANLLAYLHSGVPTYNESADFGEASDSDGYGDVGGKGNKGTFDKSSDTIAIPDKPTFGISSAGFLNVYHVSESSLSQLADKVFPSITLPNAAPGDVTEALTDLLTYCQFFVDSFQNSKILEYIVDCHILPVAPTDGSSASIRVGYKDTEINAPRVSSDYVDFDCGTVSIGEYYANYIDYVGTRARLFLPFVGFMDLKPEFWQSGAVNVTYRFNVIDGSFMAFVKSTSSKSNLSDTVIAQFGGNSCVHIPLTGLNYSSMISGLVTGSMSLMSSAASGNAMGAATSAMTMLSSTPTVAQSNNYNSSTSFLGVRRPYLMIERAVSSFATNYTHDAGLPLNVTVTLGSVTGYTVVSDVDTSGMTGASEEEIAEIRRLLSEGVYL